jgi:hypothetical protein
MKTTIVQTNGFNPVTVEIKLETLSEFAAFWATLNVSESVVRSQNSSSSAGVYSKLKRTIEDDPKCFDTMRDLWRHVSEHWRKIEGLQCQQ